MRAAGRPFPGVEVRIVDRAGWPVTTGTIGEIQVRSPANMRGYWRRPTANARTLVDGWVHTGDAGYVDGDGYLYICDRVKDMIISAGEHIYPAEVERALTQHPAVAEAAVIGVPDDRWGEAVHAVLILKPGYAPQKHEVLAEARRHIAAFKVPRTLEFVTTVPRTPSGKVQKRELRAQYWESRDRAVN